MPASLVSVVFTRYRDQSVRWRLVAGNGRAVAVSSQAFPDEDRARAAFEAMHSCAAGLTPEFTRSPGPNEWEWYARTPDSVRVAMSARPYGREGTCRSAYQRFRAALDGKVDA